MVRQTTHENDSNKSKGFASMSKDQVKELARKGGHANAEKIGDEGMAERGNKGNYASPEKSKNESISARGRHASISHDSESAKRHAYIDDEEE